MLTKQFQMKIFLGVLLINVISCIEPFHNKHNNIVTFYEHSNFQGIYI